MNRTTVGGLLLGVGAILIGQIVEGGHPASLVQGAAFIIVMGGTCGAVIASFSAETIRRGLHLARGTFVKSEDRTEQTIQSLIHMASIARKDGVLSLENALEEIEDDFLYRAIRFIVDGIDAKLVREGLEGAAYFENETDNEAASIWESAGGYSPTIGILGAVLGLIHVMENLSDPSKLGDGIAVAFVATVYGVGAANLILLPLGSKIKSQLKQELEHKLVIIEGIISIQEGLNPRVLEDKLRALTGQYHRVQPGDR